MKCDVDRAGSLHLQLRAMIPPKGMADLESAVRATGRWTMDQISETAELLIQKRVRLFGFDAQWTEDRRSRDRAGRRERM